ncbi:MAG: beta-aspartyl-peptidase [Myxococcales bacterium]|nr:beta-aspartyl-peptidase [Myxococcales bacterium]
MLTMLRNALVYAPAPLGRCDLLVGGGQLLAIGGPAAPLPPLPPALADEHDLAGARVIPGLIDGHVHVTGGGGEAGCASRVPPVSLGDLTGAGITTVVGLLGTDGTTRTVADLVARTLGLREEGLSAWCYTGSYQCPPHTLTGSVRGDIVFVDPIVGVGELALSDHRSSQPTFDELVRVAADCHVAGLTSGKAGHVHLHLGDGARGLALVRRAVTETELPARVFQPTHVNRNRRLFDEALALATAHGVPLDVTAFPADDDGLDAATAIARCLASSAFPAERLTCSSDGAGCLPVFDADGQLRAMDIGRPAALLATLATLVADGHPLERVLPVFTANVARQLRLGGKGQLTVGADADLVVLDDAGRARDVMARGRWMVRAGQPTVAGVFAPRPAAAAEAGR